MMRLRILIAICCLLLAVSSFAAVAVEGIGVGSVAGGTTVTLTVNCGSNPNRMIVGGIGINNNAATQVSSATYAGLALTLAARSNTTGHANSAEMWYRGNAVTGSNTLQFNLDGSDYAAAWGICVSGASSTLGTPASTSTTGETISVDVTGVANGMIVDLHVKNSDTSLSTPGAGQTLRASIDDAGSTTCGNNICVQASTSTETGTVTMDWSTDPGLGTFLNMIAAAISPSGAAPSAGKPKVVMIE